MHAFWLVLTYDILEDRRIDDVIIKTFFNSLLYKTNRFQVAVRLFSNRSQRTSKCGKNISDTLGCASCATFVVICDLLLNRRTTTWNLFVKQTHAKMESIFKVLWSLKGFFSWRKPTKLQSLQPITYQTRSKDNWLQLEERITVSKSRFIKKKFPCCCASVQW